ncbi:hypothetical protein AB0D57_22690 [Streptomyces sp. NPDC048275]|uniref:hypothetical protein n=1 Tax=Streptomyces sp. NPDC048275 TaxID=3155629 RepID=UPI0033F82B49
MTDRTTAVRRLGAAHSAPLASALGAALLCALITSCGSDTGRPAEAGASVSAPAAEPSPSEPPPSGPAVAVGPGGEDKEAQEEAARERAAAAASGDPVSPQPYDPSREDFQDPVLTEGDVTVYRPTVTDSRVTVPVAVVNRGTETSFYDVALKVTGPGGFDADLNVRIRGAGLAPEASWPTELTATDPGKPVPAKPVISIKRIDKRPYGSD